MSGEKQATALITGSTTGIGRQTALALAEMGWTVIVHGRSDLDCQETAREFTAKTGNERIYWVNADLSDLNAVNQMADVLIDQFPDLNVLINNAGTFSKVRKTTIDGLETTFVVNYLSRFLLVQRLLDTLRHNSPARIVDVSGMYHARGAIHFDDISLENHYSLGSANNQSKLANVLFTFKLARLLNSKEVTINTLHPGAVNTGSILRSKEFSFLFKLMYRIFSIFFKSPRQGAATSVFLASSGSVSGISGRYFENKKEAKSAAMCHNNALQDELWDFSYQWLRSHHYLPDAT